MSTSMKFESRRDQFFYLLGYTGKQSGQGLKKAIEIHQDRGYEYPVKSNVFEHCPYNDDFEQIRRSIHIFENSKKITLATNLLALLREFLFLVSDFEPPCCYDGRTFYCKTTSGQVVLQCDRCDQLYDLDEKPIQSVESRFMEKKDFVRFFGSRTEKMWSDHSLLKSLQTITS